jgi:hypothetical protein
MVTFKAATRCLLEISSTTLKKLGVASLNALAEIRTGTLSAVLSGDIYIYIMNNLTKSEKNTD